MNVDRRAERTRADLVLPFSALGLGSLRVAGGKAMNLGELTRASFPVPPGFCITTAAYELAAEGSDIGSVIEELAAAPPDGADQLEALAKRARDATLRAPVPPEVARAVAEAYRALGD